MSSSKNLKFASVRFLLLLICAGTALSCTDFVEAKGVEAAPLQMVQLSGHELKLNGVGLRTATLFAVKVYQGSLYLEHPSHDPQAILNSNEYKKVHLKFLHDVSAEKMRNAFKEGLESNCPSRCEGLTNQINELLGLLTDVKSGDDMDYCFYPNKVEIFLNNQKRGEILNSPFTRALLTTWLGPKPPTEELKSGLLGLSH